MIVTSITASNLVRGEGAAKESMIGMMIGTVTNIILDPIMILTLDMGVGGAAIATVIGNIASVVYYAAYLIKGNSIFYPAILPVFLLKKELLKMLFLSESLLQ